MPRRSFPPTAITMLFLGLGLPCHAEDRTIDGTGNNATNTNQGSAGENFPRLGIAAYDDGISTPRESGLPNARTVSNGASAQSGSNLNSRGMSDYVWQWGQFIDHDITLSEEGSEDFSITVGGSDPKAPGIPMTRTQWDPSTATDAANPRQQINSITSYIDASMIYGSDPTRAAALRTGSGGRLATSAGDMLPFNTGGLDNANPHGVAEGSLYLAGDVRSNEQTGLTAMHTLFVREHNRLAAEISSNNASWTDEQIFQRARKIVGGQVQSITYNEWLPALLGSSAPDAGSFSYDSTVDPSISAEFAGALFRFGHSLVSPDLMRVHDDDFPDAIPSMSLAQSFFNPPATESFAAYEYYLKGLSCQTHQQSDARVIDELHHMLFGAPGSGGMDLAALNIQRGRDHGLADYNTTRAAYGLSPAASWSDLSSDVLVQADLQVLYSDLDDVDLWIGALVEDRLPDAAVGELLAVSIAEEFTRLAEGDAFFYLWDSDLSNHLKGNITGTTLGDVIGRNTSLTLQFNVFFVPRHELKIESLERIPGTGVRLTFMGEPGYDYQIRYGSRLDQLDNEMLATPLSTGNATYMLQCVDSTGASADRMFYQLVRTPKVY